MKRSRLVIVPLIVLALLLAFTGIAFAEGNEPVVNVQKYDRAIHIMAMLLVGFGFLMVFVRRYGRSALTATFLLVSVAIPLYITLDSAGMLGDKTGASKWTDLFWQSLPPPASSFVQALVWADSKCSNT